MDPKRSTRLAILFIAVLAMVFLSSCALTRTRGRVILKPSALSPLPGHRPRLFVRYLPYSYKEFIVEIETPDGGGAYLLVGPALSATYGNALGAYFSVNYHTTKGVGQFAFMDFDLLKFSSGIKDLGPSGKSGRRAELTLGLTHFVRVLDPDGTVVEDIPLEVSISDVMEYSDEEDFLEGAASITADLLLRLEEQLFEHVLEKGSEGRYVPYGSHSPAPIPGFGPLERSYR